MKKTVKKLIAIVVVLVIALSSFSTIAFAAESASAPYRSGGRWLQNYTMTIRNAQWRFTTLFTGYSLEKLYDDRPFVVEVTSNTLISYSTGFGAFIAFSEVVQYTSTTWVRGTGSNTADYNAIPTSPETVCLGARSDVRATGTYTHSGIWSPDYYQ